MLVTRRKRRGNYGRHLECFCSSNCFRGHLLMPRTGCSLFAAPVHKSRGDMWRVLAGCPFAAWLVTCWHLRPDTWHFVSALFLYPLCGLSLCAIWVSASVRCLYSFRLIRTNRKYENSSLDRTCIQCKASTTSHALWAVALAGIYRFLHADQRPTATINDKLQEMILQHKVLRKNRRQIARNLL